MFFELHRSWPRILIGICGLLIASSCGPSDPGTPQPEVPAASTQTAAGAPPSAQDETQTPAIFIDVADDLGLERTHWNGMSGQFYYAEMMGSGVALFDYDNDGDLDVYLVQGNALGDATADGATFPPPGELPLKDRLFRNDLPSDGESQLRFVDVTDDSGLTSTGYGMGVTAADFDNDGWTDLYVTNLEGNQLFRNTGPSAGGQVTFEDVTDVSGAGVGRWSVPAMAFDADRDGWLDLFVGNYVEFSAAANKRCTDEIGLPNYCGPLAFTAEPDVLLRNLGGDTLRFADVTLDAGIDREFGGCLGAVAADFNGDRWLDLYVANDGMPNQLWINQKDGRFENWALLAGAAVSGKGHAEASMGVGAADFDGDGDEDLFITHLRHETNTLYVNDGRANFEDRSAASGLGNPSLAMTAFGTGWLDFDNDGQLDLLTVNGAVKVIKTLSLAGDPFPLHQPNQLFRNLGDGSFEDISAQAGRVFELSEVSRGAAFGDLDNDGDTDVVISNNSGPTRLLLNQIGQDRSWLGLRLLDAAAPRDSIGARAGVVLEDGTTLWRRVGSNASYGSSSDPRLLFGLGESGVATKILVEWPDGRSEQWSENAILPGTYTALRQGQGQPWNR